MFFKFYVQIEGETSGPYSVRELLGLSLLDDTLITEESMNGEWHYACEFDFEVLYRKVESFSWNKKPTSQKVMYHMCSDRGFSEPMPVDVMSANLRQTCTGCSITGLVSPEKSTELLKMMQDVNKIINPSPNSSSTLKRDNSAYWNCNGTEYI